MRLAFGLLLLPSLLAAQATDTSTAKLPLPARDSALRLPTDAIGDLLPWVPGGGIDGDAQPNYHGNAAFRFLRRTDGIRWATGLRSLGANNDGPVPVLLEPQFNSVHTAALRSTNAAPYLIDLTTTSGGDHWEAAGQGESEGPLRPDGGAGVSRFQGSVGGPLWGGFRMRASGTLLGREALPTGMGYGDAPYYVPTGVDTVLAVPNGDPLTDTSYVPVQRFGTRDKVPYTPGTAADWAVRIDGRVGPASVWAHWLGTRVAERLFTYTEITNPAQASGYQASGRDLAAGAQLPIGAGVRLDVALALQHERSERGPLSSAGEIDSRGPALGIMLGGLGLRFDLENFPVNEELVANYRNNIPGSRRSPYDLENTAQYAVIDQYRNNPYGLLGWSESGGPNGRLTLYEDQRLLGTGGVTWELGKAGALRIGAEIVRHDARSYAHTLVSQAHSDVWLESPQEQALTADYTHRAGIWALETGLRIDRFRTGASRREFLDTDTFSPTFGQWGWFPRISSCCFDPSTQRNVEDEAHTAAAPYVRVSGRAGDNFELHAGLTRAARMPDLAFLLDGLNTDLAITNWADAWGSDMGHEVTDLLEVGAHVVFGPLQLDGTIFHDKLTKRVETRLESLHDPARNANSDIRVHTLTEGPAYQGATVAAAWDVIAGVRLRGSYTYTDLSEETGFSYYSAGSDNGFRKHSVALTAEYAAPELGPVAGLGALLSVRRASGLARSIDIGYDPYLYGPTPVFRTEDIPAWSSVDLRVTKRMPFAGRAFTVFLDGRNVLNAENLLRAFGMGEPKRAPGHEDQAWAYDSAASASEAERNGAYSGGDIDLTFSGAGRGGCGVWVSASGTPSPPNCAYLIAAEQRFGDGDGVYTLTEQRRASAAYYRTALGDAILTGPPRAVRLGLQVSF